MTGPSSDKSLRGADGKAGEALTHASRQSLKARVKTPGWEQDAQTAVSPVDAIIPAAAFRDAPPPAQLDVPLGMSPTAPPRIKRRARPGRWLLLGVPTLLSCALAYTGFSVARKLDQRGATLPAGAESASIGAALSEVVGDAQAKVQALLSRE